MLFDGWVFVYLEWGDSIGYLVFYFYGMLSLWFEGVFVDGVVWCIGF